MGDIYRIVAPPDPAIARRKWLWLIALGTLALVSTGVIFGPGLYRSALLAREGPGDGPWLVKRADGKIELKVPPAQVLIGKPYKWRKLRTIDNDVDIAGDTYIGDFDGDGNQELLVWHDKSPAVLYKPDGTATKPGLQGGWYPNAEVYDWNGDGKDELAVSVNWVPLASWPQQRLPAKYKDFVGRILLTAAGKIAGTSNYIPAYGAPIIGSFIDPITEQVVYNSYSHTGIRETPNSDYTGGDLFEQLLAHPRYFIYGSNDKEIGSFDGIGFFSWDWMVADIDGDQLDEVLTMPKDGDLWCCKYKATPLKLSGWPNLTRPVVAGDVDDQAGDELISVRPDPKSSGYELARSVVRDEDNPLASNDEDPLVKAQIKLQEVADAKVNELLAEVGIQPRQWEDDSLPIDSRIALHNQDIDEGYYDRFIIPANILLKPLLAWEFKRPVGLIYYPKSRRNRKLQFPRCLKWSNVWIESEAFSDNRAVTCQLIKKQPAVVYCIPSVGTGLLGFSANGRCIYYEEFGTGVSDLYTLKTNNGDYLVLRVGNELRIYP